MIVSIRSLTESDLDLLTEHLRRHHAESGQVDPCFMPYSRDDPDGPTVLNVDSLSKITSSCGWERWFIALSGEHEIVGHVRLKGSSLRAGLHRADLEVGIECGFRNHGLGRQLILSVMEFARKDSNVDWIDLRVFRHNQAAIALYERLGFSEIGVITDCFRVDGESIDDVAMTKRL